jgi:peptide/nickel transport system ATP-binding protein
MLELKGIDKEYSSGLFIKRSKLVLKNITLKLERGDFLGIIGESGSGKTTLARIAARLVDPTRGSVEIDGEDITRYSSKAMQAIRRKIQIVFQQPEGALNPEYTIAESLREAVKISGTPAVSIKETILKMCGIVHVNPSLLERYPSQVSGGEIQRAALARVLVQKPEYLFLDEPTSMLDLSVQAFLLRLIQRIAEEHTMGIALITHDMDIIQCLCNKVVIIEEGAIADYGETKNVLSEKSLIGSAYIKEWQLQKCGLLL